MNPLVEIAKLRAGRYLWSQLASQFNPNQNQWLLEHIAKPLDGLYRTRCL